MATYEVESRLSSAEVLERADAFFGHGGLELSPVQTGPRERAWEGGGGAVFLKVQELERGSRVEIATQEWDVQVQDFMQELRKRRLPFL